MTRNRTHPSGSAAARGDGSRSLRELLWHRFSTGGIVASHGSVWFKNLGVSAQRLASVAILVGLLIAAAPLSGCHASRATAAASRARLAANPSVIRRVVCLYDQRPWLNLDRFADRDPEGIRYRVFLVPDTGLGVLREGMFHIEMYKIIKKSGKKTQRILTSDWHYPTSEIPTIARPGMLGDGYYLHLRWADKETAGSDIEIVTQFEAANGERVRSGTKRLHVPKYSS